MTSYLVSALALGFLGSFHCIGMCGPLAFALPIPKEHQRDKITSRLLYNAGRISSYMSIGIVMGSLGSLLNFIGWQSTLSILSGIVILLITAFTSSRTKKFFDQHTVKLTQGIKSILSSQLQKRTYRSMFLFGIANGFLPCGFVYLALAGAVAGGTSTQGAFYMLFFGLGTVPAMFGSSLIVNLIQLKARNAVRRYAVAVSVALALFLIYRGAFLNTQAHCGAATHLSNQVACPITPVR